MKSTTDESIIPLARKQVAPSGRFDLEQRTPEFASAVRRFLKLLPRDPLTLPGATRVLRSSGSVGANYVVSLIDEEGDRTLGRQREALIQESRVPMKIFGAIVRKTDP